MKDDKIVSLDLREITEAFFVRTGIDQARVKMFSELILSEQCNLPLIEVAILDGAYVVVDGRHRKSAYMDLGEYTVTCELKGFRSKAEMIAYAFSKNSGGSLPPTSEDCHHTVRTLLAEGLTGKEVIRKLSVNSGFPSKLISKWVKDVQTDAVLQKIRAATKIVLEEGKTVEFAATSCGVSVEQVNRALHPDASSERSDGSSAADVIYKKLVASFTHHNLALGQYAKAFCEAVSKGEMSRDESNALVAEWDQLVNRVQTQLANTKTRLAATWSLYEKTVMSGSGNGQTSKPTTPAKNTPPQSSASMVNKPVKALTPSQIKKTDEVFMKMGISPEDHRKITEDEFVLKAIREIRKGTKYPGIHTVFTGFNDAFRRYFGDGSNPVKAITKLMDDGKISIKPSRKGSIIMLAEDKKDKLNS